MAIQETLSHAFRDTDDPTTIHGHSGKPRRILSVTLMIQRPYMPIQENLVARYMLSVTVTIQRPYMPIQEILLHAFRDTDDPTTVYGRFGILQKTFV